ncbi:8-oxoguanine glycosylase ogg1 [Onygenales sp. PD_12]|nr:8-oxoguanine glycosylase ogg1 [Onygenales sp. PD_12]
MSIGRFSEWRKLPVSLTELCINTTLRCGQSFRWQKSGDGEWSCTLHGRIISLRQDPTHLHYRSCFPSSNSTLATPPSSTPLSVKEEAQEKDDTEELIRNYFNLNSNLTDLYEQWSIADKNFKKKASHFTGIRIMRQDAWETLVSFICSSNNNIARISQMVEKLCLNYGPLIGHIDQKPYHDFPSPHALTGSNVEARLRELGFGYRAKYIYQTALIVANNREEGWLDYLRNPECPSFGAAAAASAGEMAEHGREGYRKAHESLLELQGVGPKVADCICLMGLGWGEAVPVDTHVWQIAQRDYKFGKGKHKSLTKATYDAIANYFRNLWGKEAGWAHSVLFTADLKSFSERLTTKVEADVVKTTDSRGVIKTEMTAQVSVKRERGDEMEETKVLLDAVESESKPTPKRRRTRRG